MVLATFPQRSFRRHCRRQTNHRTLAWRRQVGQVHLDLLEDIKGELMGARFLEDPDDDPPEWPLQERLRAETRAQGTVRIVDKPLLDHLLLVTLDRAAEERFPLQFHIGFGDPDVDLRAGNPLQLRAILQETRYQAVPLILLHAGYPFIRELSYLAAVYPNVHLDLGLAIPFAATEYEEIVRQALGLAPSTRVLWSSDGVTIPEHCWFAAVRSRRALAPVRGELIARGALDREEAWTIAHQVLRLNACRVYGLGGD